MERRINEIFRKEFGDGKELQLYLITQTGIILNQTILMGVKTVYNFLGQTMVSSGMISLAMIFLDIIPNHFVKNSDELILVFYPFVVRYE